VAPVKKTNFDAVTRLRTFFAFFVHTTQNVVFPRKLMNEHRMSQCIPKNLYQIFFNIYIIVFFIISNNRCICMCVPKRHLQGLGVSKLLMAHQIKCCSINNNNVLMIVTPFHH
jgi:hypothetical protein